MSNPMTDRAAELCRRMAEAALPAPKKFSYTNPSDSHHRSMDHWNRVNRESHEQWVQSATDAMLPILRPVLEQMEEQRLLLLEARSVCDGHIAKAERLERKILAFLKGAADASVE